MPKTTHFDIGAWSREKKAKKQQIIEKNRTISELNEQISLKEQHIQELKRKVGLQSKLAKVSKGWLFKAVQGCTKG